MKDISVHIYKYYKSLDDCKLYFGRVAILAKMSMVLLCIWMSIKTNTFKLVVFFILCFFLHKLVNRRYKSLKDKNNNILVEMEKENIKFDMEVLKICLLKNELKNKGMYTEAGLKYLVEIYKIKSKRSDINGIAIGAAVVAAIVNKALDITISGTAEEFSKLNRYYKYMLDNTQNLMLYGASSIVLMLIGIAIYKYIFKEIGGFFFSQNYKDILYIIQFKFIPDVIKNESVEKIDSTIKVIPIKEIENNEESMKSVNTNKEIYKELRKINKLKNENIISKREYKKIKKMALERIKY